MAETDAILNFAENLRKLLLTPPFRGFKILSIDPGFSHGCKLAVISETGDVLGTNTNLKIMKSLTLKPFQH